MAHRSESHTAVAGDPGRDGLPATLYLYRDRVRIVAGRFSAEHERKFAPGDSSILPEHRAQRVAAVSGKRARRYLQRQHLIDLGAAALAYLTELTHRRPRTWIHEVDRLHALLQTHGDASLRAAFECGLAEQAIGAEYIAHYLGATIPALLLADEDRPSTIRGRRDAEDASRFRCRITEAVQVYRWSSASRRSGSCRPISNRRRARVGRDRGSCRSRTRRRPNPRIFFGAVAAFGVFRSIGVRLPAGIRTQAAIRVLLRHRDGKVADRGEGGGDIARADRGEQGAARERQADLAVGQRERIQRVRPPRSERS